nr:hypothetical protein [Deinococcus humi]
MRRQMIHRHRLELLQQAPAAPAAPPTPTDSAAELALGLPEPHRLYALALLCRLQDALDSGSLDAHSTFVLRQARTEYLPATLRAYQNLTPAAHARLNARGQSAEDLLREQLEQISGGVAEALGQNHSSADRLLTQGNFLAERFETSAERVRA